MRVVLEKDGNLMAVGDSNILSAYLNNGWKIKEDKKVAEDKKDVAVGATKRVKK